MKRKGQKILGAPSPGEHLQQLRESELRRGGRDRCLSAELARHTVPGQLWEPVEGDRIRCLACGHRCPIPEGSGGVCKVRFNRKGKLLVPFGYVNALHADPIEKKPFFHVIPGARALSFGMMGCSYHCAYCQNWTISQTLRDTRSGGLIQRITSVDIVRIAVASRASAVVSTYNEPLITAEWAATVFRAAHALDLFTGIVSNGNATPEVLLYLKPWLDAIKVDLKTMNDGRYHQLGGRLRPVLDSIAAMHAMGFWLEVVTLVVPGFNDSTEELGEMARYLAGVSADIPWHVTAFHPDYKMTGPQATSPEVLERAAGIGRDAGLRYVYAGNLDGQVGDMENTRCTGCGGLLIERSGFHVLQNRVTAQGTCPSCQRKIPGLWRRADGAPKREVSVIHAPDA